MHIQSYVDGLGTPSWKHGDRRVDLRRVRDCTRALPYHTASRAGHRQAAELLDPRVALELALDNCRDTSAGIGPQRLSTMAARLLRWQHVTWLDNAERIVELDSRAPSRIQRSLSEPVRTDEPPAAALAPVACAAIAEDDDFGATSSAKLEEEDSEADWGGETSAAEESGWLSSESSSGAMVQLHNATYAHGVHRCHAAARAPGGLAADTVPDARGRSCGWHAASGGPRAAQRGASKL